jgi:hypothetical protein
MSRLAPESSPEELVPGTATVAGACPRNSGRSSLTTHLCAPLKDLDCIPTAGLLLAWRRSVLDGVHGVHSRRVCI